MIPFNRQCLFGSEFSYFEDVFVRAKYQVMVSIQNSVVSLWRNFLCKRFFSHHPALMPLNLQPLIDIKSGDEIIMPSYTFVSTANAFVLGGKTYFCDIRVIL